MRWRVAGLGGGTFVWEDCFSTDSCGYISVDVRVIKTNDISCTTSIRCTPTKQGTSDILNKMSFWYHFKEHIFSFDTKIKFIFLQLFEIWPLVNKTVSGFSDSVILRNWHLQFSIPTALDMTSCRKCRIFCGKMFENRSKITLRWWKTLRYVKKKNLKIDRRDIFHF